MLSGNNFLGRSSLSYNHSWAQLKLRNLAAVAVVSHCSWRQWSLWGLKQKSPQDFAVPYKNQAISDFPSIWLKVPWHSRELSWILQLQDIRKPIICYIYKIFQHFKTCSQYHYKPTSKQMEQHYENNLFTSSGTGSALKKLQQCQWAITWAPWGHSLM